jgi:hypothetical protein
MSHFFIFIHEYIIFPLHSSSYSLFLCSPPPHATPDRTCLSSYSVFEKRELPCDTSMYICIIIWFGSCLLFSPFYLSPLLMVISTGLKIIYSFLYGKYINIFTSLMSFFYTSSPVRCLPLAWPVFHSCASLFRCLLFCGIFALVLYLYMHCA